jgi:Bacterial protein of unknown function (DUF924)
MTRRAPPPKTPERLTTRGNRSSFLQSNTTSAPIPDNSSIPYLDLRTTSHDNGVVFTFSSIHLCNLITLLRQPAALQPSRRPYPMPKADEARADRAFLNELMARHPGAIQSELGLMMLMVLYPTQIQEMTMTYKKTHSDQPTTDDIISRFINIAHAAASGQLDRWAETPRGCLAFPIKLDQVSSSLWRGACAIDDRDINPARLPVRAVTNPKIWDIEPWDLDD